MSERTFYLYNGRVDRDCAHTDVRPIDGGAYQCRDCGGSTEHPGDTSSEWMIPPVGARVQIVADIAKPSVMGMLGTVTAHTSSSASYWITLDDGSRLFAIRLVTWVKAVQG